MSEALPEPVTRWLESQSALNFILWLAAVVAAVRLTWATFRKLRPAVKAIIKLSESLDKLPEWMDSTDEKLAEIRHEVLPNNGGSLRDDVVTISLQMEQMKELATENSERVDELENTITRRIEARAKAMTGPIMLPTDSEES